MRGELECSEPDLCHLRKQEALLTIEHSVSIPFALLFENDNSLLLLVFSFSLYFSDFLYYCLRISHSHIICLSQIRSLLFVLYNTNIFFHVSSACMRVDTEILLEHGQFLWETSLKKLSLPFPVGTASNCSTKGGIS